MDPMLIATAVGSVAAIIAAWIGVSSYRQSRTHQLPDLRIDGMSLGVDERPEGDSIPKWVKIKLTNAGDGLAKDIRISTWIFMVAGDKFTVPADAELPPPHYTAHVASVMKGETIDIATIRSTRAVEAGVIPSHSADAVPIIKVSCSYRDRFGKEMIVKSVRASSPEGFEVSGYDHLDN